MDLFSAIEARHSYRGAFVDEPVPREDLRRMVEAGLLAPSGKNGQTTSFVIVDDPAALERLRPIHPMAAVQTARAAIVCAIDRDPPPLVRGMHFQIEDCAAAVENILLAVTALGYATVWIDGALRAEGRAELIADAVGLPSDKVVRVLLPVGRPAEAANRPEKRPFEHRAWFGRWGCP